MKSGGRRPVALAELGARAATAGTPDLLVLIEHIGNLTREVGLDFDVPPLDRPNSGFFEEQLRFRVRDVGIDVRAKIKAQTDAPMTETFVPLARGPVSSSS